VTLGHYQSWIYLHRDVLPFARHHRFSNPICRLSSYVYDIKANLLFTVSPHLRVIIQDQIPYYLAQKMRFFIIAIIVSLAASVSACSNVGDPCNATTDCCGSFVTCKAVSIDRVLDSTPWLTLYNT